MGSEGCLSSSAEDPSPPQAPVSSALYFQLLNLSRSTSGQIPACPCPGSDRSPRPAGLTHLMKLAMYTLTKVAIRYWQSKRSMIPPCPGMVLAKSCQSRGMALSPSWDLCWLWCPHIPRSPPAPVLPRRQSQTKQTFCFTSSWL